MHGSETNYSLEAVPIVDASSAGQLVMRICLFRDACHRVHEDQSVSFRMNCCMKRETQILARQALSCCSSSYLAITGIVEGRGRDGQVMTGHRAECNRIIRRKALISNASFFSQSLSYSVSFLFHSRLSNFHYPTSNILLSWFSFCQSIFLSQCSAIRDFLPLSVHFSSFQKRHPSLHKSIEFKAHGWRDTKNGQWLWASPPQGTQQIQHRI